jgi:hypothetical protein
MTAMVKELPAYAAPTMRETAIPTHRRSAAAAVLEYHDFFIVFPP